MALIKGGRLEAKVIGASKNDFTIRVQSAKGHEDDNREITLPMSAWNGAGAQVGGEKLGYDRKDLRPPKMGETVVYDSTAEGVGGGQQHQGETWQQRQKREARERAQQSGN
jgi:hypothetical protein